MKLWVRNRTARGIARGGYRIRPDGEWHEIDVPDYRASEVLGAAYLDVSKKKPTKKTEKELPGVPSTGVVVEEEDADSGGIVEYDLEEMEYKELQELAKEVGVPANQSKDALVEALGEALDSVDEDDDDDEDGE